jgi:hypothetical protein
MQPPRREPPSAPRQLNMPLDPVKLRAMTPIERGVAVALLASLLLEAAGVAAGKSGDDDRV